jgi:hypothetical protein
MKIYALQIGPCSFLKFHISPWEILFPFLLCSSSFSVLSFSWHLSLLCLGRRLFQGLPACFLPWHGSGSKRQHALGGGSAQLRPQASDSRRRRLGASPGMRWRAAAAGGAGAGAASAERRRRRRAGVAESSARGTGGPRDGAPVAGCAGAGVGWSRARGRGGARAERAGGSGVS